MNTTSIKKLSPFLLAGAASAALVACGFGSGGGDVVEVAKKNTPVNIEGKAATGLALVDAPVTIQCALPTKAVTGIKTDGDGKYNYGFLDTEASAGPCVVTVTPKEGGTPLTSITNAAAGQTSLVANVTPLTTMVVNALVEEAKNSNSSVANPADLVNPEKKVIPQDLDIATKNILASVRTTLKQTLPPESAYIVDLLLPDGTDLLGDRTFKPATTGTAATDTSISKVDKLLDVLAGKPDVKLVTATGTQTLPTLTEDKQLIKSGVINTTVASTIVKQIVKDVTLTFDAKVVIPPLRSVTGTASGG